MKNHPSHPRHWVFTFRVEPPTGCTFMARNDGEDYSPNGIFQAAYSRLLRQWYMVYPGGEEKIGEPQMIFVSKEYADTHRREEVRRPTIKLREGKQKSVQLSLF